MSQTSSHEEQSVILCLQSTIFCHFWAELMLGQEFLLLLGLDLKCLKYLGFTDFTLQKLFIMTTFFPQRTSLLYIAKWGRICANQLIKRPRKIFLDATSHLYNRLCPLVGRSVGWLVGRVTHSLKTSNSCIFSTESGPDPVKEAYIY